MKYYFKPTLLLLLIIFTTIACNKSDQGDNNMPINQDIVPTETEDDVVVVVESNPCPNSTNYAFIENNGIVTVEAENASISNNPWEERQALSGYSGNGYIDWRGSDFFGQPGQGVLNYTIRISTPGTYRFIWRSRIAIGADDTEHNDSWLRIPNATHFYGKKADGNIVYPKETNLPPIADSSEQDTTEPDGAGGNGWFKIYMNIASAWEWQSNTSDNDPHEVFAVFETAGDYTVEISGRSNGHAIDKFVLFNENVSLTNATSNTNTASEIVCE